MLAVAVVATAFALSSHGAAASGVGYGCVPNVTTHAASCTFKGSSAIADFSTGGNGDCVVSGASVFVSQQDAHNSGGTSATTAFAVVGFTRYDSCTNTLLADGWGNSDNITFTASGSLETATLSAVVSVYDYPSGTTRNVTVSVKWTGVGGTSTFSDNQHTRSANFAFNAHYTSDVRSAIATGTFSDGTVTFSASSAYASLLNAQGGTLEILH